VLQAGVIDCPGFDSFIDMSAPKEADCTASLCCIPFIAGREYPENGIVINKRFNLFDICSDSSMERTTIIFPPFQLDPQTNVCGEEISQSLQTKSLCLLLYLVQRPAQLVTKEELLEVYVGLRPQ
jgi:DNA-binding response OmpR family regulator